MVRFSPLKLLIVVTLAGVAYATWFWNDQRLGRLTRAAACRANLNLIDKYVAMWERASGALDAGGGPISITFRGDGTIVAAAGAPRLLEPGSDAIARLARDPLAFVCPAEPRGAGGANHYRWMMAVEPLAEQGGALRGAVCLAHGGERPVGERPAWHALVKGRKP